MPTVGVAGHRVLCELDRVRAGIDVAWRRVRARFSGPVTVLSCLAEGADRLIAVRALADRDVRLVVPLPLPATDYVADFVADASRAEFERLLARAEETIVLPPQPTRSDAYRAAAEYLVDRSDALLVVWDGQPEQGPGGAAAMVERARRRARPLAWVHAGNRRPGTSEPRSLGALQGSVTFEHC